MDALLGLAYGCSQMLALVLLGWIFRVDRKRRNEL